MNRDDLAAHSLEPVVSLLEGQDFEHAARMVGRVLAAEPRNAKAWCLMTRAQLGQGRSEAALAAARAASSISPHAELPHRLACDALLRLGRTHEAVLAARDAVRFAPRQWRTHHALSQALLADQAYNDARLAAEHAVKLAPDQAEPHVAAALAARCQHRLREARSEFERALEIDAANATAQNHLITLRHRTITPRGLAGAVNAFAEAAASGHNPSGNRQSTEFTVTKFMSRFALLLAYGALVSATRSAASRPAALLLLALAVLYALSFLIALRPPVRGQVAEMVLRSRKLKAAGALQAVAIASMLASLLSLVDAPGAAVTLGGLCACAAAVFVQFARIGTMRDLGAPDSRLVYRRTVRWLAITAGLSAGVGLVAAKSHPRGYELILPAAWVPVLAFLVLRARSQTRRAR